MVTEEDSGRDLENLSQLAIVKQSRVMHKCSKQELLSLMHNDSEEAAKS